MAGIKDIKLVLEEFGVKFKEDLITSLKRNDHTPGGQSKLAGTFDFTVFGQEQSFFFEFYMADYGSYLDTGTGGVKERTGSKGMIKSLREWMTRRQLDGNYAVNVYKSKLKPKNRSKSRVKFETAESSLAWAIKKSIHKNGIRQREGFHIGGSNWFTEVLNDGRVNDLSDKLTEILGREVVVNLEL